MAKKVKKARKPTKGKKTQASRSTVQYDKDQAAQGKNKKEKITWQFVVRVVIIALLVFALSASLFFGILSSAYSLPLQQAEASQKQELELPGVPQGNLRLQPDDLIDGQPAESYAEVTDDLPDVVAPMAALFTREGRLLFERNIDNPVSMASTTKMMTAIVALENLDLETPLTVAYGAANTDGTNSGLEEGMVISLHDCLYALLIPSGNDAAVVIAENVSGMESRFVELMNAKAAELGMTSTNYSDASGLTAEEHYTTVRDYMILTRYCMSNKTFREIVATQYYEVEINGTLLEFEPTDMLPEFLSTANGIGVKTGYTEEAGYCFVGAAELGGIELYSIVFNSPDTDQRFLDSANLLEWGMRHYRTIELINTSQQVADVAVLSWIDKTVPAYVPAVVRVELFDLNGPITQDISITDIEGEATKGRICGEIIWSQGGEVLSVSDVVVGETILAPDFFEGIGIAWERFIGGFSDKPAHMETSILLKSELTIPDPPPVE